MLGGQHKGGQAGHDSSCFGKFGARRVGSSVEAQAWTPWTTGFRLRRGGVYGPRLPKN